MSPSIINSRDFFPYLRDEKTLARPWAIPGTPGLEHRVGGIETAENTGHVSYDPENHHNMVVARQEKVNRVQDDIAEMETQLNAELENLDETVAAGIRKELENVAAEGDQAVAFAQELHDAAKAGAVCLRASAA